MAEGPDLVAMVRQADAREGLLATGSGIVVAVSGGADSVALLDALHRYAPERGLALHVGHLDHGLRPTSEEEAAAVGRLAAALGLPATIGRRDVRAVAGRLGRGLEAGARSARYAFLAAVAAETGSGTVAVAHTLDDQAETVLLHLARGAGLDGLRAMAWRSPYPLASGDIARLEAGPSADAPPPTLVRPFLGVRRGEIEAYAAARGLPVLQDPSNLELRHARNRIRHDVLPALESVNPRVREALARLAEAAREDVALVEALVAEGWERVVLEASPRRVILDRAAFLAVEEALARRLLRRALAEIGGVEDVGWSHVEAARRTAGHQGTGGAVDVPGGRRVRVDYRWLVVERLDAGEFQPGWRLPLAVPGETALPGGWVVAAALRERAPTGAGGPRSSWEAVLPADRGCAGLWARARRAGDRIALPGLRGGRKTLQDLFVDARVPRAERPLWPVVESGEGILWLPGLGVDRSVLSVDPDEPVVVLSARPPARVAAGCGPEAGRAGVP